MERTRNYEALTDKQTDRTDENYTDLRHTSYAGGIIKVQQHNGWIFYLETLNPKRAYRV